MLELEKSTFATLDSIKNMYEQSTTDEQKVYHLSNMMSVIKSLKVFMDDKMALMAKRKPDEVKPAVSVAVAGNGQAVATAGGNGVTKKP